MKKIILLYIVAINLFCFVSVLSDKRIASAPYGTPANAQNRIAEVQIVSRAAMGGAIGTYAGFVISNHKTSEKKVYLRRSISLMVLQNLIGYGVAFYFVRRRDTGVSAYSRSYIYS